MKEGVRKVLFHFFGQRAFYYVNNTRLLIINFFTDFVLYFKHSSVFYIDNENKRECQVILDYHSIEKGFLFRDMKPRFAVQRVNRLHDNLAYFIGKKVVARSQVNVAMQVMCQYYELHERNGFDIGDYFNLKQYTTYREALGSMYEAKFSGAVNISKEDFYKNVESDFYDFSYSRKSIRNYTDELVDINRIRSAVKLAINAPSVCNRQAAKVYYVSGEDKVKKALSVQGGLNGYTESIKQLLILTQDRNYFYTAGERNQLYIDGGIFLMNLLYALHYYRIANCPANWGKLSKDERNLEGVIRIPESEKIICMIPIGIASESIDLTHSRRRSIDEIFTSM